MNILAHSKSVLLALVKVALTCVIFYFIAKKINLSEVQAAPIQNKIYLVFAFTLALVVVLIQALRWHLLCNFLGFWSDIPRSLKVVWAGHLLNNILPTSAVGDVLRSYSLRSRGARRSQWVGALLIEKYFAVTTALLLAGLVALSGHLPSDMPEIIKIIVLAVLTASVSATLLMRLINYVGTSFFPSSLKCFLETLSSIISKSVNNQTGVMTLVTSFLVNILICLIFYCIAQAMALRVGILDCLFIVPVFTILAGLPISYGGWGVREMTSIQLLQYFGVEAEIALFATILFGVIILLSSLPGLLFLPAFRNALNGKENRPSLSNV